jgi:hypothetical protein
MDKRQKTILIESLTVIVVTVLAVVGLINFKDWVNRSEAIKAMEGLSKLIQDYRSKNGILPPESYVEIKQKEVEGWVRLGKPYYRGLFIEPSAKPNEILAYAPKPYRSSFLEDGYVVMFLDGTVKWMQADEFERLLETQRAPFEAELTERQ